MVGTYLERRWTTRSSTDRQTDASGDKVSEHHPLDPWQPPGECHLPSQTSTPGPEMPFGCGRDECGGEGLFYERLFFKTPK